MSRRGAGVAKSSGRVDDPTEVCPVCKTLRYLNKDLEFLINPKCYHPMCNNCVNRLFAHGQNPCPYAGCGQKLRRQEFRSAYFGDLAVEREVDERKRVAKIFNQTADDFETLLDYNNHLDKVESLIFDLVSDDRARRDAADAALRQYEAEHKAQIERSRRRGAAADERARSALRQEQDAAAARRREAREQDKEEQRLRALAKEEDLDSLTRAPEGTASTLVSKLRDRPEVGSRAAAAGAAGGLSIRGLKEKKRPVAEGPYNPFAGLNLDPCRYQPQESYINSWLDQVKSQPAHVTGGYSFQEYCARSLFEAFAGLAVVVADEKDAVLASGASAGLTASQGVSMGSGNANDDRMEIDGR